jgi:hypothetical protein
MGSGRLQRLVQPRLTDNSTDVDETKTTGSFSRTVEPQYPSGYVFAVLGVRSNCLANARSSLNYHRVDTPKHDTYPSHQTKNRLSPGDERQTEVHGLLQFVRPHMTSSLGASP